MYVPLSPSRRREAPCEGTNSHRLFTPGETKALAKSEVHQISRAWLTNDVSVGGHPHCSQNMYVCMYVKLYLKTLAPSTVRWFPRGASTMLKITKDFKGKEDYLQIGVTPDVMVRRCYNLFQIYIVLELSFN